MNANLQRRILILEPDTRQLARLRRELPDLCPDWNISFLQDIDQPGEITADERLAAVVAALEGGPPKLVAYFEQLKLTCPDVLRVGLVSEPGLRLKPELAGLTDYELSRQCSGAVLERALRRRLLLHSLLRAPAVKRLLSQLHQVPSVPRLYLKLLEEVQSPQHSLDGVAAIVRQDPAMTAKILQLVNSPYFALSREIRDTAEAVLFLGLERIRSLVLMVHFFTSFESSRKYQWFSVEQLWQHSFATANLAAEMAEHETKDPDFVSETYSAGLLHDLGKLVLAANIPDRYERIVHAAKTSQTPVWKTERDQLGATHAELGGALAGLWQLPLSIVEAIAFHHRPSDSGNRRFSPLALVHLADVFENETAATPYESRADLEYLEVLGRTDLLELWKKLMELKSSGESTRRPRH